MTVLDLEGMAREVMAAQDGAALAIAYDDLAGTAAIHKVDLGQATAEPLCEFAVAGAPGHFCYDESAGALFFAMDGELYKMEGMQPESLLPVAALPLTGETNALPVLTQDGFLIAGDSMTILRRNTDPSQRADALLNIQQNYHAVVEGAFKSFAEAHPEIELNLVESHEDIIQAMLTRRSVRGYKPDPVPQALLEEIVPHDLVKFGIIPELVGRLPVIAALDELRRDDLVRILTEPKNALVKQYQKLLSYDGAELVFDHDALEEIADKAIERKIGARGLRAVMEGLLTKVMYDIPSDRTIERVTITRDCVDGKEPPQLGHRKEALQEGKPAAELPPVEPAS